MAERRKKGFILHEPLLVQIEILTDKELVRLIRSMVLYHNEGIEEIPEEDRLLYSLFYGWKKQYHKDKDDYEKICARNKANGMKGGAPKGNQNAKKQPKTTKNNQNNQNNQNNKKQPKQADIDIDKDIDIDIDTQDTNVSMSLFKSSCTEDSLHSDAVATQPKTFRDKIVAFFNVKMEGKSIKPIRSIKEGTKRAEWLKARRREYGDDAIMEMIEKASMSKFLNGYNTRGFVASFDWMMRPNNFPKVLEGNYDDRIMTETTIQQTDWQS